MRAQVPYWLGDTSPQMMANEYGIATASKEIEFRISPIVTSLGGAIGGILGFLMLVLAHATRSRTKQHVSVLSKDVIVADDASPPVGRSARRTNANALRMTAFYFAHLAYAMVLGAIVTILLVRGGEQSAFFAIHIRDLWGAITIGIVAELLGYKALETASGVRFRRELTAEDAPAAEAAS